jgi:hypothetical protein
MQLPNNDEYPKGKRVTTSPIRKDIMFNRLKASLILAPCIFLLLTWIGCFGNLAEIARIGVPLFLVFGAMAAIVMAYLITLYISFIAKTMFKN